MPSRKDLKQAKKYDQQPGVKIAAVSVPGGGHRLKAREPDAFSTNASAVDDDWLEMCCFLKTPKKRPQRMRQRKGILKHEYIGRSVLVNNNKAAAAGQRISFTPCHGAAK